MLLQAAAARVQQARSAQGEPQVNLSPSLPCARIALRHFLEASWLWWRVSCHTLLLHGDDAWHMQIRKVACRLLDFEHSAQAWYLRLYHRRTRA